MAYFLIFLLWAPLLAVDLGVMGHTFPIEEVDLLELLKQRMQRISSQELAKLNERVKERYCSAIKHPAPIKLPQTLKYREFTYDPTIVAKADIKDDEGNVIVEKGTTYNPLSKLKMSKRILFFDGTNPKHVEWARKSEGEWVLVNGSPIDLEKEFSRPVYFDQGGALTQKLGVLSVPAQVSQEGSLLKIEEIPVGAGL